MTLTPTQLRELAEAATPGPCPGCGLSMRDEPPLIVALAGRT